MSYLTFSDLTTNLSTRTFSKASVLNESIRTRSYIDKNVFLSYRREDRVWVDPVVRFLKRIGIHVYIDYMDETLEDKTNDEVAKALRDRINMSSKFISLSTPNSSKSKWMPWELGLGDRIINYPNVAVLPLTHTYDTWGDQEYGKIYGRIENIPSLGFDKDQTWYVLFPNNNKIELKTWLLN